MKAIKAVINHGQIVPEEPFDVNGSYDAIVVVLDVDPGRHPTDPRPRPELDRLAGRHQEYLQGKPRL